MVKSYFGGLFLISFCLIYFDLCLWLSFLCNELRGAAKFWMVMDRVGMRIAINFQRICSK